jgi:glycine/D-amino acid oxidase-like deaminating enzyme/nitrite reductase/ring-hydroxylating ferredoxin subunit
MLPPYWNSAELLPRFPRLDADVETDVVVIGGGLTGLTAAYLIKRAGRRVVLLERGRLAAIDTGSTTAHLTCVTDTRLIDLARHLGDDHARAVWDAGLAAIAQIAECIDQERIDCHFAWVPAYLHTPVGAPIDEDDVESLIREADTATRLGFDARFLDRAPFVDRPAVEFEAQARFHPALYLRRLAELIDGDGSAIYEQTPASDVEDDPLTVVAGNRRIRCEHVVVATHNPIVGKDSVLGATLLQTKLALYSSYVVSGRVEQGRIPDALFWDTADPYRYLRIDPHDGFDQVIYGGEDHKTGQDEDVAARFQTLEAAAKELIPGLTVTHRWSGQVIETNDGLPYMGEVAPRQFAVTGFSGNGMTFGTVAAMMARDYVVGLKNPWSELFDVGRTRIRGGLWDYVKENKDYPYYLIRDRFAGADGRSLREVPRGAGKILELDGRQVAAYRHSDGEVTLLSATCTHMGCRVMWNTEEHTWDCPCHGSRFAPTGDVLSGPAETPLEPAKVKASSTAGT